MRLFSEATLLKMETACTRRPKRLETTEPSFWDVWRFPTLSLKPTEVYAHGIYLRLAVLLTLALLFFICAALGIALVISTLMIPNLWPTILDPKNHKHLVNVYYQEGWYQFPLVPLFYLLVNLAVQWPRYFFWNRRAKRLQREGLSSIPTIAAAIVPDDPHIWPPAPRS